MKSVLLAIALCLISLPVRAAVVTPIKDVVTCPGGTDHPPVRFDLLGCARGELVDLDPQNRDLWLHARVGVGASALSKGPLGLFVSAKAASVAYVNGVRIGQNGTPGAQAASESPGRMDAVFFIPPGLLHVGENDVVLRLSSFHNVLRLARPVHVIAIAPFGQPLDMILRAYWPSLVTFGVLLAGAFVFASSALSKVNRREPILLAVMSVIAALQLFAEAYRGLAPYPYPVQDWRLITLATCASLFAITLAALVIFRFVPSWQKSVLGGVTAVILFPLVVVSGYDGKATFVLLVATVASALIAGYAALKGSRAALIAGGAFSLVAVSIFVFQGSFLDALFYYEAAAAILILFTVRVVLFERERRKHESLQMRAHDLELALARAMQSKTPAVIRVNSAGALTMVNATDIAMCKGADDYVELHLSDGRSILHNGALVDLEKVLPRNFLRVHRSFLVNTGYVEKLTREATGVGMLTLATGAKVPVSRRIMPKVRNVLGGA
ncbi:hypothetical protein MMA231_03713 (plasmid) [Asticcacaulis sp. MM231]|uniref:LytTR family DNA-binding domain-containing protein n=1 Tax=Asticcacaulis sp. MM231 TaxID=3157666 RepID=UPI0032D57482